MLLDIQGTAAFNLTTGAADAGFVATMLEESLSFAAFADS